MKHIRTVPYEKINETTQWDKLRSNCALVVHIPLKN